MRGRWTIGDIEFGPPWWSEGPRFIKKVVLENGVTSIGKCAFGDCENLTSITIPDTVTSIKFEAFAWCCSLTSIKIPDSVTSIGSYAFWYCENLTSVTIPDSVTSIGEGAFEYCDSLKDVYYLGAEEDWNAITIGSGNECLTNEGVKIHYNTSISGEMDTEVQAHINFYNANESNFLKSSNDLFYDLKNEAEKDEGALWYKLLFDMDSIFELDDAYHQEMTVQTIMVELLCSEESIDNAYTSFLNGGEEGTDKILDAVAYKPDEIIGIINGYDVQGELKKVLSIKDRSSAEFLKAKNEWFQNSIDSLDLKKLQSAMKDLGYVADLTNMAFEDAKEFYNFYATSESYKAADQYMKDALGVLAAQMIVQASLSSNNMRTWAVAEECAKQYEKITDTSEEKYYEYGMELIKEDGLKFGEKATKKSMIFIVNKCVEISFPQVAAALKIAGVTLEIGIHVFESITKIDERVLERDLYLNLLVFQDAATGTVRHLANEMEKKQTTDSVKTFEYGFDFYRKILRMTTDHGIKYCTLKKADRSISINMQVENSAVNLWKCHGENTNLTIIKQSVAETFYKALLYWFRCPVNIEISKEGVKVAEIIKEDIVYYSEDASVYLKILHITESEHPSKFLIVPANYDVKVTGFADGAMSFEKAVIEDGTILEISNIEDIPVKNGSVYTEVIEENKTIAIECDLDNDGLTDQTVTAEIDQTNLLGDLNADGNIDATDAAAILVAAAAIGSGAESGLTDEQETAADVNGDGDCNAIDAAIVLQYAAADGSRNDVTIQDFV